MFFCVQVNPVLAAADLKHILIYYAKPFLVDFRQAHQVLDLNFVFFPKILFDFKELYSFITLN